MVVKTEKIRPKIGENLNFLLKRQKNGGNFLIFSKFVQKSIGTLWPILTKDILAVIP